MLSQRLKIIQGFKVQIFIESSCFLMDGDGLLFGKHFMFFIFNLFLFSKILVKSINKFTFGLIKNLDYFNLKIINR